MYAAATTSVSLTGRAADTGMTGEDGKPFTDIQLRDFVLNFMCVDSV